MKDIRRAVFFIIILFSIIFRNSISFAWMESAWDNTDIDSLWLIGHMMDLIMKDK